MYVPSSGATTEATASCQTRRRVVGTGQLEPLHVHDRHVRIEEGVAQPDAFDLGGDPLSLFGFDQEVIDVLVLDHAVDRRVERDLLRLGEIAVRLDFFDLGQRADVERPQIADAGGGANAHRMLPQPAIGRDRSLVLTASSAASRLLTSMPGVVEA